jgi:hypothetical protein
MWSGIVVISGGHLNLVKPHQSNAPSPIRSTLSGICNFLNDIVQFAGGSETHHHQLHVDWTGLQYPSRLCIGRMYLDQCPSNCHEVQLFLIWS